MSQHHFVIVYDTEQGWSWEAEVEEARFNGGGIYLPETDEWVDRAHDEELVKIDHEAFSQLLNTIGTMNYNIGKHDEL